jgi:hypothetical protein
LQPPPPASAPFRNHQPDPAPKAGPIFRVDA